MQPQSSRPPRLSARQQQLCQTIERLTAARHGLPPSMREVAAEMKLHPSRIAQLAVTTAMKGALIREPGAARAWRVVKLEQPAIEHV